MHSVGVLFKQLLSNRDFCLRDPSDLVPFPLNSEENRSDYESSVIIPTWWEKNLSPDDSVILWKKLKSVSNLFNSVWYNPFRRVKHVQMILIDIIIILADKYS